MMKGIVYYVLACVALLLLCISLHFAILSYTSALHFGGEKPVIEGRLLT